MLGVQYPQRSVRETLRGCTFKLNSGKLELISYIISNHAPGIVRGIFLGIAKLNKLLDIAKIDLTFNF